MKKIVKNLSLNLISIVSVMISNSNTAYAIETIPAAKVEPKNFISNGEVIDIPLLGFKITPPKEWHIKIGNTSGPVLVMEEPKENIDVNSIPEGTEKISYQRNLTVAVKHTPIPVDAKQITLFTEELNNTFGKNPLIANFSVIESSIVKLGDDQNAILVYTSFTMGKSQLMQMHFLASSASKQYLQTYTDLADRFKPEDLGFTAAWTTMNTFSYDGNTIARYEDIKLYGTIGGSILLLIIVMIVLRKISNKRKFAQDTEECETDFSFNDTNDNEEESLALSSIENLEATKVQSIVRTNTKIEAKTKKKSFFSKKSKKEDDDFTDDLTEVEDDNQVSFVSYFN